MKNLRPLLRVNSAPAVSEPVSKVPYDIMKVAKSKFLPGRLPIGFCLVLKALILGSLNYGIISILAALLQSGPPPTPPRARLVTTTAAAATTIALVVARVIFMRRNPGAAKDGSAKVFIVARVIFERRKPK